MGKPIIISVMNQKGGVAKTTTTENLCAAFTLKGYKTLLVDMDPSANATTHCGYDPQYADPPILTLYEVLSPLEKHPVAISQCILHCESFDLAPASKTMSTLDAELASRLAFKQLAKAIRNDPNVMAYDIIVIDCGPVHGMLHTNILCAANYCLMVSDCSIDGRDALEPTRDAVLEVRDNLNDALKILGVAITKYEQVTKDGQVTKNEIYQFGEVLGEKVFDTKIRQSAAVAKAKRAHKTVIAFAPKSNTSIDYMNLADEIISELREKGEL